MPAMRPASVPTRTTVGVASLTACCAASAAALVFALGAARNASSASSAAFCAALIAAVVSAPPTSLPSAFPPTMPAPSITAPVAAPRAASSAIWPGVELGCMYVAPPSAKPIPPAAAPMGPAVSMPTPPPTPYSGILPIMSPRPCATVPATPLGAGGAAGGGSVRCCWKYACSSGVGGAT